MKILKFKYILHYINNKLYDAVK